MSAPATSAMTIHSAPCHIPEPSKNATPKRPASAARPLAINDYRWQAS